MLAGRKIDIRTVEEYLQAKPELKNRIRFLDYISETEKMALYRGAAIFVFPTLYEGFGLPILEAQSLGTPVITSSTASNAEVAGQGAAIVDPESPYEIAEAIEQLLSDQNLREEKVAHGFANVKRFSWEQTARNTLRQLLSESIEDKK